MRKSVFSFLSSSKITSCSPLIPVLPHRPFPTLQDYDPTVEYIYDKPWQGGINYIIGVALAVLIVRLRPAGSRRHSWSLVTFILGWGVSFIFAYFVIFGLYYGGLETRTQMTLIERTAYAALARPAWAIAIGWVRNTSHMEKNSQMGGPNGK